MMINILDSVAESLESVLADLSENPSVSIGTVNELHEAVAQITAIHNELCRIENE